MRLVLMAGAGLFLLAGVIAAPADTVHLINGQRLDGIIRKETKDRIVLTVGTGDIILRRGQIKSIERSVAINNDQLRAQWRDEYFDNEHYVPEGCAEAARRYRGIVADRQAAVSSVAHIPGKREERRRLMARIDTLQGNIIASARVGGAVNPTNDVRAFNEYALKHNEMVARQADLAKMIKDNAREEDDLHKVIAAYAGRWSEFNRYWTEFTATPAARAVPDGVRFVARVREQVAGYSDEFSVAAVPVEAANNRMIVEVRFNDRVTTRMLIDTGASIVSISESLARQLNLTPPADRKIPVKLADGSLVDARPVHLASVAVGTARLEEVQAVVMPGASQPLPGVEGLLGMSYLGAFIINMTPAGNGISITEFRPKKAP